MLEAQRSKDATAVIGGSVLVIDDNAAIRTALDVLLSLHGISVLMAVSPEEGLTLLRNHDIDLVIQDMNFRRDTISGEEGIELFHLIRDTWPDLPVMLLTAWTHLETAIALVKAGAADYMAKPWNDTRLITSIRNLLQLRMAVREARTLQRSHAETRAALAARFDLRGIVYDSDAMHSVLTTATHIAHADVPVLITGPSGTGKEVLAEIVQANSSCRNGPFIKVNVGALPAELMESELFGAENGAFTGARAHAGRFEAADGGTVFLDEIGNLSLAGQAKLLRVLQTGEFERLGSSTTQRVKVRVISATNSNLRLAITQGRFREDLYYRLNVIELRLPPLSERRDDVLPLAQHFLMPGFEFNPAAERALLQYHWPGNVRELKNCIQRACLLSTSRVIEARTFDLACNVATPTPSSPEPDRDIIEQALLRANGVVAQAARDLGFSRQALYRRIEKLGIKLDESA